MSLSHSPKITTNGLVCCLDANDPKSYSGSGSTCFDRSSSKQNGTLSNITFSNNQFEFNGTTSQIQLVGSSSLFNLSEYTFLGWFKTPTFGSRSGSDIYELFSKWGNTSGLATVVSLDIRASDNRLRARCSDAITRFTTTGSVLESDIWYLIGVQFKDGLLQIYLNGELDGSSNTGAVAPTTNGADLYIGRFDFSWGGYAHFFEGLLGSVLVYNKGLSLEEHKQNYNATKSRFGL